MSDELSSEQLADVHAAMWEELGISRVENLYTDDGDGRSQVTNPVQVKKAADQKGTQEYKHAKKNAAKLAGWKNLEFDDVPPEDRELDQLDNGQAHRHRLQQELAASRGRGTPSTGKSYGNIVRGIGKNGMTSPSTQSVTALNEQKHSKHAITPVAQLSARGQRVANVQSAIDQLRLRSQKSAALKQSASRKEQIPMARQVAQATAKNRWLSGLATQEEFLAAQSRSYAAPSHVPKTVQGSDKPSTTVPQPAAPTTAKATVEKQASSPLSEQTVLFSCIVKVEKKKVQATDRELFQHCDFLLIDSNIDGVKRCFIELKCEQRLVAQVVLNSDFKYKVYDRFLMFEQTTAQGFVVRWRLQFGLGYNLDKAEALLKTSLNPNTESSVEGRAAGETVKKDSIPNLMDDEVIFEKVGNATDTTVKATRHLPTSEQVENLIDIDNDVMDKSLDHNLADQVTAAGADNAFAHYNQTGAISDLFSAFGAKDDVKGRSMMENFFHDQLSGASAIFQSLPDIETQPYAQKLASMVIDRHFPDSSRVSYTIEQLKGLRQDPSDMPDSWLKRLDNVKETTALDQLEVKVENSQSESSSGSKAAESDFTASGSETSNTTKTNSTMPGLTSLKSAAGTQSSAINKPAESKAQNVPNTLSKSEPEIHPKSKTIEMRLSAFGGLSSSRYASEPKERRSKPTLSGMWPFNTPNETTIPSHGLETELSGAVHGSGNSKQGTINKGMANAEHKTVEPSAKTITKSSPNNPRNAVDDNDATTSRTKNSHSFRQAQASATYQPKYGTVLVPDSTSPGGYKLFSGLLIDNKKLGVEPNLIPSGEEFTLLDSFGQQQSSSTMPVVAQSITTSILPLQSLTNLQHPVLSVPNKPLPAMANNSHARPGEGQGSLENPHRAENQTVDK